MLNPDYERQFNGIARMAIEYYGEWVCNTGVALQGELEGWVKVVLVYCDEFVVCTYLVFSWLCLILSEFSCLLGKRIKVMQSR